MKKSRNRFFKMRRLLSMTLRYFAGCKPQTTLTPTMRLPRFALLRHILALMPCLPLAFATFSSSVALANEGAANATRNFNLPADVASRTLQQFSEQAGVQVLFPTDLVHGIRTNAVRGGFTPRAALAQMVAGTPLVVVYDEKTGALGIKRKLRAGSGEETKPVVGPASFQSDPSSQLPEKGLEPNNTMRPQKTITRLAGRLGSLLASAAALLDPLAAQTATPARTKDNETTIVLSPFEVTAQDDGGYLATRTLAGTRFNTDLKDVPASLSIMTADFLKDINASNISEALQYTISAEPNRDDSTGNGTQTADLNLRMRGFAGATLGRNFFQVQTAQDTYNIERLTFSRGPNSVIFGNGGAGGIADASTKRAQQNNITQLTTRIAPFDDYRFEFDINRPIVKTLAVRVNTLYWTQKSWRDLADMKRKSAALAVTWKPFSRTTLRLDAEYGVVDELKVAPWPVFDNVTNWINGGRTISQTFGTAVPGGTASLTSGRFNFISNSGELLSLQNSRATTAGRANANAQGVTTLKDQSIAPYTSYVAGPGATSNNDFLNAGVFFEQQVFQNLFIEAATNHQQVHRDWNRPLNWSDIRVFADPNALRPNGTPNPYVGQYYVENTGRSWIDRQNQAWDDYRLTASYKFDLGRLGTHQIAGLWSRRDSFTRSTQRQEAWANNPANAALNAGVNAVNRRTYISFFDAGRLNLPSHFQDPFATPINANGIATRLYFSNKNDSLTRFDSVLAVLQSKFFKERLVTAFGLRRDTQSSWGSLAVRDPLTQEVLYATGRPNSTKISGDTRTAGAVLHVTPWLSFAANSATNGNPQDRVEFGVNGLENNKPLGAQKGVGLDVGARFAFLDKRINGSITYYETSVENAHRFKFGNFASGYELWFREAYLALGKPFQSISGEDTVDIASRGWETEWTVNLNRNFRLIFNGSKTAVFGSNQFPRITRFATGLIGELRARPNTPIENVAGISTAGALADLMQERIRIDHLTEGKPIQNQRPYSGNVFANYRFTEGRLKGAAVSVGVISRGRQVIGSSSVTGDPVFDGDNTQINASLSYSRPIRFGGKKIGWEVTLAGTNIFGSRHGLLPSFGDEIGVDRFNFEITPTVSLANRFKF